MSNKDNSQKQAGSFHLDKWFLDFTGSNGEAMIFYAAKLRWHRWSVSYTSWLHYDPSGKVQLKSRFRNVQMPRMEDDLIRWDDTKFGVSGMWRSRANTIESRIFDSQDGYLDWKCYQPSSRVNLVINGNEIEGDGYAEQLILTAPPWKIPMDELRWGRFISKANVAVWIELRQNAKKQWLWLNGDGIENCIIEDDCISMPDNKMILKLDRGTILESEKKIFAVVQKIIRYIPGFNKAMPISFLMADEYKWLSKGQLRTNDRLISEGMAIHELVNFKPTSG